MSNAKRTAALAIAAALAIPAEGLRQTYYYDPPGILTVCYGHTGQVDKAKRYSLDECKVLLDKDMQYAVNAVDKCQPGLPVEVLASFADAAYNMGPNIACNTAKSTAARMLKSGDIRGACLQLDRWNKASFGGVMIPLAGLTKRRAAERDLCLTGAA